MHLVSDPDQFDEAIRRKFPFFRTACGTAQPNKKLTKDPNLVTCPMCRKLIEQMLPPAPHPKHAAPPPPAAPPDIPDTGPATDFELDDDLFDDLDEMDELPSQISSEPEGEPGGEPEAPSGGGLLDGGIEGLLGNLDQVADMIGSVMPMLGLVTAGCETDPDWKKWVLDEHQDEPFPGGALDDIRTLMAPADLSAIRTLYGFGKDFGLDPLFGLLISILHRQVVARAEALDASLETSPDEGPEPDDPNAALASAQSALDKTGFQVPALTPPAADDDAEPEASEDS